MKTMKTKQFLAGLMIVTLLAPPLALAVLTATVSPGYQFSTGEAPTLNTLNMLAQPSVQISGTVDGSTGLTPGSVYGNYLADNVVDNITLDYNASSPRAIEIMKGGASWLNLNTNVCGRGLSGGWDKIGNSGTNLNVNYDNITLTLTTNNALKVADNFLVGLFTSYPATPVFTNNWGLTNAFAITNYAMLQPTNYWTYTTNITGGTTNITTNTTATTLADNDTLPVKSTLQHTNTTATLKALAWYVADKINVSGITFTNLNRQVTNWYGGMVVYSDSFLSAPGPWKLYSNTNSYAVVFTMSGTWSINNGTWAIYLADAATNSLFGIVTNSNSGTTLPFQEFVLPPNYGIYAKRTAGGSTFFSYTLNTTTVPY